MTPTAALPKASPAVWPAVALAASLLGGPAHAQPSAADQARAEALFDEGKRLMEQKRYAEACPKLEESQRLDEGGGTLAALALCHQGQGRSATAWAEFKALLALANRTGHADRKRLAEAAIVELEPKLCWLTVAVTPALASQPGFAIRLDGSALGSASWGSAFPVDPGAHSIEARADGKQPWRHDFSLGPDPERRALTVPPLAAEPAPPLAAASSAAVASAPPGPSSAPVASAPAASASTAALRRPSLIVGGLGLALLAAGGYFGVSAIVHQRQADKACPEDQKCRDDNAIAESKRADREAWAADVGLGLGAAALVAAYLLWPSRAASPSAQRSGFGLRVGLQGNTLHLRGEF